MVRIAQLFERLCQADGAELTRACGVIQVDHLGQDGLVGGGFLQDATIRVDHGGTPTTPGTHPVDTDKVALVEQGIGTAHHQLKLTVGGRGQGGLQDDLRSLPYQAAGYLREPHVVADAQPKASHIGDIEHAKLIPRCDTIFIRQPGEHLAVFTHNLTLWRNHQGSIVQLVTIQLVHRAGDEPAVQVASQRAQSLR